MPDLPTIQTPFAAMLLAGGKSRRMGRDKAMLPLPSGGLLWERQLGLLRTLGPAELFVSGPARPGFPADITLLADEAPDLGPLSGVVAALEAMASPLLVVLAVDLPAMQTGFLHTLLTECGRDSGVVPRHQEPAGFYEPLAAIYPKACLEIGQKRLRQRELALQSFVRDAVDLLQPHLITADEEGLFINWNEPTI